MDYFLILFSFLFGTIIGSFLNVVALRYNTGKTLGGRSKCMSCDYHLHWYDLIPVVSWCLLRGSCRKCKSIISSQYPLVEFGTGALFALTAWKYAFLFVSPALFILIVAFVWIIMSVLVVIVVYDIRHTIIPDALAFVFATLAFARILIDWNPEIGNTVTGLSVFHGGALLDIGIGLLIGLIFYLLWLCSGGRWMGLGDAKLVIGIGWLLGFPLAISGIVLAFWTGTIFALSMMMWQRYQRARYKKTVHHVLNWGSEVPFAPFLILGMLIVFFTHIDVTGLQTFLL